MSVQARLGVPENGRATAKAASTAFATYAKMLRDDLDWFDGLDAHDPDVALQHLVDRVTRVADALAAEADHLGQRACLHDATRPEPIPLLGVAVDGDRGLELLPFSLDRVIDDVRTTTGPAASVLEERGGGARKEPF